MSSTRRLALIAGLLYLLNAVTSGFAFGYVLGKVYVPGNSSATAANVLANAGLVRFGVVLDLFQATEWIFLAMALYLLLRAVHENAARAMVVLVAVGAAITCLNDAFQLEAVRLAGTVGSSTLVLMLLDLHHFGFLVAQIFFGLWLVPLGFLAYRSAMFPKVLGIGLVIGAAGYLIGLLAVFLVPDGGEKINTIVTIPSAIAEISMVLYLLVLGVRSPRRVSRLATA